MSVIAERFINGGIGMYPTLVFGLPLLLAAMKYAITPQRRFVPLLIALGFLSFSSGALGFVSGLITTFEAISRDRVPDWPPVKIAFVGMGESLNNLGLALFFITLASILASVGAWKLSRNAESPATT